VGEPDDFSLAVLADDPPDERGIDSKADGPADPFESDDGRSFFLIFFSSRRSRSRPGSVLKRPTMTPRAKVTINTRAVEPWVWINRKSTVIGSSFCKAKTTVRTASKSDRTSVIRIGTSAYAEIRVRSAGAVEELCVVDLLKSSRCGTADRSHRVSIKILLRSRSCFGQDPLSVAESSDACGDARPFWDASLV